MVLGGIPSFASITTHVPNQKLECASSTPSSAPSLLKPGRYQRLYFRNANHPISRPSVTTRRQDRTAFNVLLDPSNERRMSHVFDGQTLSKETAAFQLVDIHDPMLKAMIEDPAALRETCDVSSSPPSVPCSLTHIRNATGGTQPTVLSASRPCSDISSSRCFKVTSHRMKSVKSCSTRRSPLHRSCQRIWRIVRGQASTIWLKAPSHPRMLRYVDHNTLRGRAY